MKKLIALLVFAGLFSFGLQAQNCSHANKAEKTSVEKTDGQTSAAKAVSLEADVEERVNAETGEVTYVRKSVCEKSGKVSFTSVEYSEAEAKFVNVSPKDAAGCGSKTASKSCCADKAGKASKAATTEAAAEGEKAGCAGKAAEGKACCSKKDASKAAAPSGVKLVKSEEN